MFMAVPEPCRGGEKGIHVYRVQAGKRSRSMALALAMGLGLGAPTSSDAVLTELFVGGMVLFEVAGIVKEALPQVAALATSLGAVVKTGQEVGGTVGRILDILVPGRSKAKGEAKAKAKAKGASKGKQGGKKPGKKLGKPTEGGTKAAKLFERLELRPAASPSGHDAGEARAEPASTDAGGEAGPVKDDLLDALLRGWTRKRALELALEAGPEEAEKAALEEGLVEASREYETHVDALRSVLLKLSEEGKQGALAHFVARVEDLPEGAMASLAPVLEQLFGRGESFRRLHTSDEDGPARALAPLRSTWRRLREGDPSR